MKYQYHADVKIHYAKCKQEKWWCDHIAYPETKNSKNEEIAFMLFSHI